jgi:hypothetical protein
MKKLLTILLLTVIASVSYAGALRLSFVQNWPDYSITVKVTAGSVGAPYGFIIGTFYNGTEVCETYYDCPIDPGDWGNVLVGDPTGVHGCPQTCATTYTYKARPAGTSLWGGPLILTTYGCSS